MDARFLGIAELTATPSTAVVIDVMRACTVAAWAFARGAERIVLAESLDDALALKARHPDWLALKDGAPAPGFDAVNSPALLRDADLAGRTVVQKTTAGTVGALAVKDASLVLCAGFVVAEATAQLLRARECADVTFVVTGEDGRAEEDLACAQYIAHRATGATPDAAAHLHRAAASRAAAELTQGLREGAHPDDAALCLELDRFPFAMAATQENGLMVLRRYDEPGVGGGR
ncbi:2-phosphosulfolactate phosphatase [Streptomyces sp. SKN60]|uniref:2-phosphosulfolactate phosphatase n=1 Tax=Streptomyces sp. SKN60 TaxID=2855506 RepID=UPI0022465165|nr:2-phosphosulfolactate phosphatase [Streptomyces sp. SKN60]MCX2181404.1 2-phosphosulfolactate phosphatase [Streptomyces sp. SKN60]